MGPKTLGELVCEYEKFAAEVNRDMPGATLAARMREAMKRNRGSMNPLWVKEALMRTHVQSGDTPPPPLAAGEEDGRG